MQDRSSLEDGRKGKIHTFGSTINEGLQTLRVVRVNHVHKCGVDPSPRLYGVETTDDEVELHVVVLVLVLDLAKVTGHGLSILKCSENMAVLTALPSRPVHGS